MDPRDEALRACKAFIEAAIHYLPPDGREEGYNLIRKVRDALPSGL